MNIIEYALQIKDFASGTLAKVSSAMRKAKADADALASSGKAASQGWNLSGMLRTAAVSAAAYKAGELLAGSVQAALDRQQVQVSFDVMTGGKEAGSKLTSQLVKLQKDTVLGAEVFKNAQTMLGFGFDSTEVLDNLTMLGNVSMGDAERLGALTLAFSQVRAAGKLTGQDLLQFINAGFNPLQQIAESTGRSMADLKDAMAEGGISFAMVQQAFKDATGEGGRFNDMLGKMAATSSGQLQQLAGAWEETKIKIGEALEPLTLVVLEFAQKLLPVIESATVYINSFAKTVAGAVKWAQEWKPLIAGIAVAAGSLAVAVKGTAVAMQLLSTVMKVYAAVQAVVNAVMAANPVFLIIAAVGVLIGLIVALAKNWEKVKKAFVNAMQPVMSIIDDLKAKWQSIVDAFRSDGIVAGIKRIGLVLLDFVMAPVQKLLEVIAKIPGVGKFAAAGAAKIAEFRKKNGLLQQAAAGKESSTGATQAREKMASTAAAANENRAAARSGNEAITSAGPKTVNINVQKFFDNINFNTTNLRESADQLERTVLEVLSRVLVQGASQAV